MRFASPGSQKKGSRVGDDSYVLSHQPARQRARQHKNSQKRRFCSAKSACPEVLGCETIGPEPTHPPGKEPLMEPLKPVPSQEPAKKAFSLFDDFKNFALKGNVVDLAIGVIIGAAFGK